MSGQNGKSTTDLGQIELLRILMVASVEHQGHPIPIMFTRKIIEVMLEKILEYLPFTKSLLLSDYP